MTDPNIYKAGVQVKGDGQKLVRDFPAAFPHGVTNLLELTQVARAVDPLGIGPGNTLVSLSNLSKRYLGKELDKEDGVRRSNWMDVLSGQQRECEWERARARASACTSERTRGGCRERWLIDRRCE